MSKKAVRGTLLDCVGDPWKCENEQEAARYIADGLLVFQDGLVLDIGEAEQVLTRHPDAAVDDQRGNLIVPGFIDVHVHYAQTRIIGSFGRQLLDWLQTYTFPEELKFRSKDYADEVAAFFFDELARLGTTSVQSFATTSPHSVEAFFEEAQRRDIRAICGLTGIDREGTAPDEYRDTPEGFYEGSKLLLERFHEKGRCLYAITPRFSFGSTDAQMKAAQRLAEEHPDAWIQTHLSENPRECQVVLEFFPDCKDYLETYERYGLVRKRAAFGHCIYLSEDEFSRLGRAGASVAFCPSSNLFLGSGHFQWDRANHHGVLWGLGSDSGGGNSMSLIRTLDDAYKTGMIQAVCDQRDKDEDALRLSAIKGLYAATLGSARCLDLDDRIGNFQEGKEADFVVLDTGASRILDFRRNGTRPGDSLQAACHQFFGLMMLWCPEAVKATFIAGRRAYVA
jgi:guanine deaminase